MLSPPSRQHTKDLPVLKPQIIYCVSSEGNYFFSKNDSVEAE